MTPLDSVTTDISGADWQRYNISLKDGGSMYAETNLEQFIVEPWNAFSSLLLILPAVYWIVQLKNRYRAYPFITLCIPLMFLGGLGSTLFHAFRSSPFFLYLDVLPTAILTLALGVYFWLRITSRWWLGIGVVAISLLVRMWVFSVFPQHTAGNLSYAITGAVIFLPLVYILIDSRFQDSHFILLAIGLFAVSLLFRELDAWEEQFFPMGTHFLWHIFSAAGAFALAEYLYYMESTHMRRKEKNKPAMVASDSCNKNISAQADVSLHRQ